MELYPRAIVAADVHGEVQPLAALIDHARRHGRPLILLGDYVNRGASSRQVLDLLIETKSASAEQFVFLLGNHERALLRFLEGGPLDDFAAHGGLATMRSYLGNDVTEEPISAFRAGFPDDHLRLIREMPHFLEDQTRLFSHTGFDPADIWLRTEAAVAGDGHPEIFSHSGPWPRPRTYFGHYVQTDGLPWISERLVCLDTGCGTIRDAPLTAFDTDRQEVFSFAASSVRRNS
jgi:serine/threonine protein phosphatase 1